jgi:hypothetical protein
VASTGKAASEKATPKTPKGRLWILFAKLKAVRLPVDKVEAKIVTTNKLT